MWPWTHSGLRVTAVKFTTNDSPPKSDDGTEMINEVSLERFFSG